MQGPSESRGMECSVCSESIHSNDCTCTLKSCSHTFHTACIQRWIMVAGGAPTCPLCRNSSIECEHHPRASEHNSTELLGDLTRSNALEVRALGERVAALERFSDWRREVLEEYPEIPSSVGTSTERLFTVAHACGSDSE